MIPYRQDKQSLIPTSDIKIIGLGGAGANIIDRLSLTGLKGPEVTLMNTDIRTLGSSVAKQKIQLGIQTTRGLGCGGDPALGFQAAQEAQEEIRAAIRERKIVFLCVGLGGGTGSGAAPLIARIAREENAFTVVFATMPFRFEGTRRRAQAEATLNELAAIASTLVTFDNGRMTELVLATKGIHEAFKAADVLISESIQSISRIALYPGLINIGLDDLVSALSSNRSRCLFGSGKAKGEDRIYKALEAALGSPLLDKGALLEHAEKLLVHLCGGPSLTLFETNMLMKELKKHLHSGAEIFFGVSVDESMKEEFTVTLISSLPEESIALEPVEEKSPSALSSAPTNLPSAPLSLEGSKAAATPQAAVLSSSLSSSAAPLESKTPDPLEAAAKEPAKEGASEQTSRSAPDPAPKTEKPPSPAPLSATKKEPSLAKPQSSEPPIKSGKTSPDPTAQKTPTRPDSSAAAQPPADPPLSHPVLSLDSDAKKAEEKQAAEASLALERKNDSAEPVEGSPLKRRFAHLFKKPTEPLESASKAPLEPSPPPLTPPAEKAKSPSIDPSQVVPTSPPQSQGAATSPPSTSSEPEKSAVKEASRSAAKEPFAAPHQPSKPVSNNDQAITPQKRKNEGQSSLFDSPDMQGELELGGRPKGRFEGESPNLFDGKDLDIPTYLRDER